MLEYYKLVIWKKKREQQKAYFCCNVHSLLLLFILCHTRKLFYPQLTFMER